MSTKTQTVATVINDLQLSDTAMERDRAVLLSDGVLVVKPMEYEWEDYDKESSTAPKNTVLRFQSPLKLNLFWRGAQRINDSTRISGSFLVARMPSPVGSIFYGEEQELVVLRDTDNNRKLLSRCLLGYYQWLQSLRSREILIAVSHTMAIHPSIWDDFACRHGIQNLIGRNLLDFNGISYSLEPVYLTGMYSDPIARNVENLIDSINKMQERNYLTALVDGAISKASRNTGYGYNRAQDVLEKNEFSKCVFANTYYKMDLPVNKVIKLISKVLPPTYEAHSMSSDCVLITDGSMQILIENIRKQCKSQLVEGLFYSDTFKPVFNTHTIVTVGLAKPLSDDYFAVDMTWTEQYPKAENAESEDK